MNDSDPNSVAPTLAELALKVGDHVLYDDPDDTWRIESKWSRRITVFSGKENLGSDQYSRLHTVIRGRIHSDESEEGPYEGGHRYVTIDIGDENARTVSPLSLRDENLCHVSTLFLQRDPDPSSPLPPELAEAERYFREGPIGPPTSRPRRVMPEVADAPYAFERLASPLKGDLATQLISLSADRTHLLCSGLDGVAELWNVNTGQQVATLGGHPNDVSTVALSSDACWALTACADNTPRLWDTRPSKVLGLWPRWTEGNLVHTLKGHTRSVYHAVLSADGRKALSGSHDNTLRLWNRDTGETVHTFTGHTEPIEAVALSADGRRALSSSLDRTIRLWDIETGNRLRTFKGRAAPLAISPDGSRALSAPGDESVRLWNLDTGEVVLTLEGHTRGVDVIAPQDDWQTCIVGAEDYTLRLWDLRTGKLLSIFDLGSIPGNIAAPDLSSPIIVSEAGGDVLFLKLVPTQAGRLP